MIPKNRRPSSPGEILLEEFLKPLGMTQSALAEKMEVPIQRVNTLINGKRGVSAETALKLGRVLETTPEFWMNLQVACDLWDAQAAEAAAHAASPSSRASPPRPRKAGG
jgi:addiction module HigA family antidote